MTISDLPYLHAAGDGGPRDRTQVVVIHATDNTASAAGEASYATRREDGTSAHFYVDDTSAYRGLPLDNIAYGCLWHGNQISVQFELCGRSNAITDATMCQAVPLVAEVCARYGIPVRKVTAAEVRAGVKGICGHADITAAFPEDGGDHTDPGASFPWVTFIGYVQGDDDMDYTWLNQHFAALWDREGYISKQATDVWTRVGEVGTRVDSLAAQVADQRTVIDTLAAAVITGGGNVDIAPVLAKLDANAQAVRTQLDTQHAEEMAALTAQYEAQVDALQAQVDALKQPAG